MSGPDRCHEAGFTLLELLVVVALMSLLTLLTVKGVRSGQDVWAAVERRAIGAADMRTGQDVLRRAIAKAYPAFAYSALSDRRVVFEGNSQTLMIVAPLPEAIEAGVMALERFFIAEDGSGYALFEDWRLDLPVVRDGVALGETRTKLIGGIRAARFAYFGSPSRQQAPQWLDQWVDQTAPPALVRIRIEPEDQSLPAWPDLVVQPRAMVNTACLYDPNEIECRRIR